GHRNCSGEEMERYHLPTQLNRRRASIRFTGWLSADDLADWYAVADVLVVPSWYEPFGMVVLEGMLYGLSVAASAVGGPIEILDHERTGLLFPPRNATAIAAALIRLPRRPSLRHRLRPAAAGAGKGGG